MAMAALRCVIVWYDKDGVALSTSNGTNYTTDQTSYVTSSITAAAPANAAMFTA
jgi:hypothetical protein